MRWRCHFSEVPEVRSIINTNKPIHINTNTPKQNNSINYYAEKVPLLRSPRSPRPPPWRGLGARARAPAVRYRLMCV